MKRPRYTCPCGFESSRWELVTIVGELHVEHADSFQRHLLDNPACNELEAERRRDFKEARDSFEPAGYDDNPGP